MYLFNKQKYLPLETYDYKVILLAEQINNDVSNKVLVLDIKKQVETIQTLRFLITYQVVIKRYKRESNRHRSVAYSATIRSCWRWRRGPRGPY